MSARSRLMLSLTLAGLLLNALLLWWKLGGSAISGCGGADGCDGVLASRWSQVCGIPIPVAGVIVYSALGWAIYRRQNFIGAFCCAAIAGSAVWLIVVQAVILQRICPWCMAAHAVGIALAVVFAFTPPVSIRGLIAGLAAACGFSLLQVYGPAPTTHRVGELRVSAPVAGAVHSRGPGRKVSFDGGRKIFDASSLPRLGSADAAHVMVEYFDYQCAACRKMSGYLAALTAKHPGKISVLLLPVPLDHPCNPALAEGDAGHPGSCDFSRIALAVWRTDPGAFPEIHRKFLADPPPDPSAAVAIAESLIAPAELSASMADPWIDELLQADISDWVAFSQKTKQLPKLLIRDKRILHGLPSSETDFIRVMEQELGL